MNDAGPTNYIFDGDPNLKSDAPLYFVCKKCKEKIWKHVYNEHVHNCRGMKTVTSKNPKQQQRVKKKAQKVKLNIFGSSRSKHRRTIRR